MCYSAQIEADYRKYVKMYGAYISIREFAKLYWERTQGSGANTPKAMDEVFADPIEAHVKTGIPIEMFRGAQEIVHRQELFTQRQRLAEAERKLQERQTKAAAESRRIATNKINSTLMNLEDLKRTELLPRDSRIYPGWYAPVMIVQAGERVVVPMRFRCRLPGWTEADEREKPGTYNARMDRLTTTWRKLFGHQHGVILADRFYENVKRDGKNVVLRFDPVPAQRMLLACLWNRSELPGEDYLLSFTAITVDPPPEVAAAGHDRCIVPIRPEHLDAWLNPNPADIDAQFAILDDRERPYYEHEVAKAA